MYIQAKCSLGAGTNKEGAGEAGGENMF